MFMKQNIVLILSLLNVQLPFIKKIYIQKIRYLHRLFDLCSGQRRELVYQWSSLERKKPNRIIMLPREANAFLVPEILSSILEVPYLHVSQIEFCMYQSPFLGWLFYFDPDVCINQPLVSVENSSFGIGEQQRNNLAMYIRVYATTGPPQYEFDDMSSHMLLTC